MKAFTVNKYGRPLHEADVAEPIVGPGDVLVRVEAAGLNHLDEKIRRGEFRQILPYRLPLVLGNDLAGTVIAVGATSAASHPAMRSMPILGRSGWVRSPSASPSLKPM